jgi:serine/threonine-protein kinase
MKACPVCGRLYPVDSGFCPVDGAALSKASQAPILTDGTDPRLGQLLCERYQLRRVVADGGMGRVYEALDLTEGRHVAVKVLHQEVARDRVQVERFKREFEVSQQLPHEHIVEVLDFISLPEGYVLVMEFLYGEELRSTLDREKVIGPARAVRMLSQIAIGLDKAHARKLVHRDLKPDNIFLCQTPEGDIVKLLDFGSVKDKAEGAKKLTVMGTTIGSPYYMAPEQAQGLDTLDHRADVWALAAILFESLTGKVPFPGKNGPMILLEILTKEAPSASELARSSSLPVPPSVDPVLERAFKKAPALRFSSVGELADARGRAYGLEGDHRAWAQAPESDLARSIEGDLPSLMSRERARPERTEADAFFGEADALGEQAAVPARPAPALAQASPEPALSDPPPAIPGVRGGVPLWLVMLAVGAIGAALAAALAC